MPTAVLLLVRTLGITSSTYSYRRHCCGFRTACGHSPASSDPAPAASVSSEHRRIGSKGSDAFRPARHSFSCSSLLRSDARMADLYRVSTGMEQSSGDLHRAPVYVSSAVLGGAMVGARIAFGPRRK